jgi:hypothetical protein
MKSTGYVSQGRDLFFFVSITSFFSHTFNHTVGFAKAGFSERHDLADVLWLQ